jgi:pimeloyl-ACP methyl ester carboxylesterase
MSAADNPDHVEIQLEAGTVRYRDLGEGDPIVFVHGLLVDGRLWDGVAKRVAADGLRAIVPDWPMGSHIIPMNKDADLSPHGQAKLVADLIKALGLERATIVGNDSGGAVAQMVATRHPEVVERLVLTNCDCFDNFPPFPFSLMPPIARLPGGMTMLQTPFRIGALARATFGLLAKQKIPAELVASWLAPGMESEIRRDTRKLLAGAHKRQTLEAAEKLRAFDRPALLTWGVDDRFFKLSYAERLQQTIPDCRLELIADAKTFSPMDQPERIGELIAQFVRGRASSPRQKPGGADPAGLRTASAL